VQGGQFQLPSVPTMGFVVAQNNHQHQQQQLMSPILMHSPTQGQQIIATHQPQILTHHSPGQMTQGAHVLTQQAQFITQNESNKSVQRKMMVQQKTQQQKFYPQLVKQPRTMYATTTGKNQLTTLVQNVSVIEEPEEEGEEMAEQEDEIEEQCENEQDDNFIETPEPDMIEELHHGSQQILHSSAMLSDGQCGIMNIDDITIEMDEINDLNEYLNAIDEEDNRMSQMGLSSLQQFSNSPPDTTTHSPRSPNDMIVMQMGSERSNGSSEGNNMVSSSEADSNVVSPEGHLMTESVMSPSQNQLSYNNMGGYFIYLFTFILLF
jgi:hypothetical protein